MLWSEIVVLFIAALMAFVAFILCILICTMYSNYKKKLKRMSYFHSVYLTENGKHHVNSHNGVTLTLSRHPGSSEERPPRQQSGTEVGVPMVITGHSPTPPEG
ncbi:hypothetical protein AVEN_5310-1, partial [Araneus ventricosus]